MLQSPTFTRNQTLATSFVCQEIVGFSGKPIRFKSGMLSPVYIDNRRILGDIPLRRMVCERYEQELSELMYYWYGVQEWSNFGIVAVATGGIAIASMLADRLNLPLGYIRPDTKKHGKGNLIEGLGDVRGRPVILFEDHVTLSTSSAPCLEALKQAGAAVRVVVSNTSYDFAEPTEAFARLGVEHHNLLPFRLLREALAQKLTAEQMETINDWHADPWGWTQRHQPLEV